MSFQNSTIEFGNITWLILEVREDRMLLLNEKITEQRQFHINTLDDTTWGKSSIRKYLNNNFYKRFTLDEQALILESSVKNPPNPYYQKTQGGRTTKDKIFLLSVEEVVEYFGDSGCLARNSQEWEKRYSSEYEDADDESDYSMSDEYNKARIAFDGNGNAVQWWLRTPGVSLISAACVYNCGVIRVGGDCLLNTGLRGIRPAMWVRI